MAAIRSRGADTQEVVAESFDGIRRTCRLPRAEQTVGALRRAIAEQWRWPPHRTRVVFSGERLDDDDAQLGDAGLLTAAGGALVRCWLAPAPQPARPAARADERGSALAAARDLAGWARGVPVRFWAGLLAWCVSANLMGRLGFGNPYLLLSAFVLIFANLGQRKLGELSAYNVFNPQFQELLGQLRAEHLEADLINPHRIGAAQ